MAAQPLKAPPNNGGNNDTLLQTGDVEQQPKTAPSSQAAIEADPYGDNVCSTSTSTTSISTLTLTAPAPTPTPTPASAPQKSKVQFQWVAVREYARSMGDNPSAEDGPPLGLDWHYKDVIRDSTSTDNNADESGKSENNASHNTDLPITGIPIDVYEQEAERRRRIKLVKILQHQEKSRKRFRSEHHNKNISGIDTLSEQEMKQLSARWLKIQPIPGKTRERIILRETTTTKAEIEAMKKSLVKLRQQRKSTVAMSETIIDDWQIAAEFFKRRYRRFKTGISKEQEQENLWEQATQYWTLNSPSEDDHQQHEESPPQTSPGGTMTVGAEAA